MMDVHVELSLFIFENTEFETVQDQVPESVLDSIRMEVLRTRIRTAVAHFRSLMGAKDAWEGVEFVELSQLQQYPLPSPSDASISDNFQLTRTPLGTPLPLSGWAHQMVFLFQECEITVLVGNGGYEFGSFHIKELLKFDSSDFRTYRNNVISALLAAAIISPFTMDIPSGTANEIQYNTYTCSTRGHLSGSQWGIEDLVIEDLIIHDGPADLGDSPAIMARQLCLRAAGYDPGPVDGIQGPLTNAAAEEFAKDRGNIRVDWQSRVFLRHLVQAAIEHQKSHSATRN